MKNFIKLLSLCVLLVSAAQAQECVLRQSTASQSMLIGPFLDSTDGNTVESGLTIANTDIRVSKNGANIIAKNSGGATYDEVGMYTLTWDATDTNTVGKFQYTVAATGALIVWGSCTVVEEAVYDQQYAASATGAVPVASIAANAITATSIATDAITAAKIAADAIGASELAANAIGSSEIASAAITNAKFASGAIDATAVAANAIGASEIATDAVTEIQSGLATSSALATVDSNVDSILVDTGTDIPARFDGVEGATFSTSTDSLEAIRNRGDSAWTTGGGGGSGTPTLADNTAQSGTSSTIVLASAETFANDELNGNRICINGGTGAGQCRNILDYVGSTDTATVTPDWTTNPSSDSDYYVQFGSVNVQAWNGAAVTALETSADIADAVHDEATSGHTTAGTFGKAISDTLTKVSDIESGSTILGTNVVQLSGDATAADSLEALLDGTGGALLSDNTLAAILADTNELQTDDIPGRLTGMEGATFSTSTDSLEAIRNRGDAAWTTGAGGSAPTVTEIRQEMDANSTQLAKLGTPAGASMSADIAAVKSDSAAILTDTGTTLDGKVNTIDGILDNIANGTTELNVGEINGCTITGDGNATPFDSGC